MKLNYIFIFFSINIGLLERISYSDIPNYFSTTLLSKLMTILNDCNKIEFKFIELRESLWKIAIQNEVLNPGEMNLLKNLDDNVDKIRKVLSRLKKVEKVTTIDKKLLNDLLQKLFDDSVLIAKADNRLDREEIMLLRLIRNTVKSIYSSIKQM